LTCNFSLELSSLLRFDCFEVSFMLWSTGSCGPRPAARLVLPRLLLPNLTQQSGLSSSGFRF
jgi:hypothetical protein